MVNYSQPSVTEADIQAVIEVLRSGQIAGYTQVVAEFEQAVADYTGYTYAIAVNSATSALYLAYLELREYLKERGERIDQMSIPAITFVATANMAIKAGFEVRVKDMNFSPVTENEHVTVSYGGYPVTSGLIADDAHYIYPGMSAKKGHVISVLSTHALKPLTTGEGGVVLTDNAQVAHNIRAMSDHGRGNNPTFGMGYNFRMSAINAAIGLSQLGRLDEERAWRNDIAEAYFSAIATLPVKAPMRHERHAWHLFVIQLQTMAERNALKNYLAKLGWRCAIHYPPLQTYPHIGGYAPNALEFSQTALSIPMFAGMTPGQVTEVINGLEQFFTESHSGDYPSES